MEKSGRNKADTLNKAAWKVTAWKSKRSNPPDGQLPDKHRGYQDRDQVLSM